MMRPTQGKFLDNIALTQDFSSEAIIFKFSNGLSIASIITGTPVGTLYFEGSNSLSHNSEDIEEESWIILTPYNEDITVADGILTFIEAVRCKWIRIRYDFISGSGFITSTYFTAGT